MGVWHEPPRHVGEEGQVSYYLGTIRDVHTGDKLTGITLPVMLKSQLLDLPVGSGVRTIYLGWVEGSLLGYRLYKFDVTTWAPIPEVRAAVVPQ